MSQALDAAVRHLPSHANSAHTLVVLSLLTPSYSPFLHAVLEVELSRAPDAAVRHIFTDASGAHTLVVLAYGGAAETHYLHAKWPKPRPLARLRGVAVSAAAFDASHASDSSTGCGGSVPQPV